MSEEKTLPEILNEIIAAIGRLSEANDTMTRALMQFDVRLTRLEAARTNTFTQEAAVLKPKKPSLILLNGKDQKS